MFNQNELKAKEMRKWTEFSVKGGLHFKIQKTTLLPAKNKLDTILIALPILFLSFFEWNAFC